MALAYNDLQTRGWLRQVATGTNVTSGAACRIMALHVSSGTDAASVTAYNATAASGTDALRVGAGTPYSHTLILGPNGTRFENGLSVAATGTAPIFCVFYVLD